ncbi:tetratricopeptide repeat protein [Candidatus Paracaedibacter symbiosus]|uniref:tetratricopeptide repeat protein n=1 Tax=Candidatus Paracaedibacter symbiosus TaxID=244582 RepID=UPI0005097F90|nr:tetratricopeptide repeat protein [Candidatus Paracaedibacter symbiosus]
MYTLEDAIEYSIPTPVLLNIAEMEEGKAEGDWWNKGNYYFRAQQYKEAFTCFHHAVSEAGDNPSNEMLLKLADCYRKGKGTQPNVLQALYLYMQTSNLQNSPTTLFLIGKSYLHGLGIPKDGFAGLYFLEESAKRNNIEAIQELYHFYSAKGKYQNPKKAEDLSQRAQRIGKPIPSLLPSLNHHPRPWKKGVEMPSYILPERLKTFIESFNEEAPSESYLTQLWKHQQQEGSAVVSSSVTGMGGVGKSSLTLQYAYEALDNKAYKHIYWLKSETDKNLIDDYITICRKLKIPFKAEDTNDQIIESVKEILSNEGSYLLIYDNVPSTDFLDRKIPQSNGHIVITSRIQGGWGHPTLRLNVFRPQDSLDFLFKTINVESKYRIEQNRENKEKALQVATQLDHLPLALSHAAAYINCKLRGNIQYNFNDYYNEFEKKLIGLLQPNPRYSKGKNPVDHKYLILTTLEMAKDLISDTAQQLLTYFAYLDPDALLKDPFLSLVENGDELDTAFEDLTTFSLIKNNGTSFSIHRLAQLALREHQKQQASETISTILNSFHHYIKDPNQSHNLPSLYFTFNALQSHIRQVSKHLGDYFPKDNRDLEDFFINLKIVCLLMQGDLKASHSYISNKILSGARRQRQQQEQSEKKETQIDSKEALSISILKSELQEEQINLREEDYPLLLCLIPNSILKPSRIKIAEIFHSIEPDQRQEFTTLVSSLLKNDINHQNFITMKHLASIKNPTIRRTVAGVAKNLFEISQNTFISDTVIDRLAKINDAKKIEEGARDAKNFFTESMDNYELVCLVEAFAIIKNPLITNAVILAAQDIITPEMAGAKRRAVIKAFAGINNPTEIDNVAKSVKFLITQDMEGNEIANIIGDFAKLKDNDLREKVTKLMQDLCTEKIKRADRILLSYAFCIGGENYIDLVNSRIEDFDRNVVTFSIIAGVVDHLPDKDVIELAKQLITQEAGICEILKITRALSMIKDLVIRADVARLVKDLTTQTMNGQEIEELIITLARIENAEIRADVARLVKDLTTQTMNGQEIEVAYHYSC